MPATISALLYILVLGGISFQFIIKNHPGEIMQKLRNVFTRAELDESEVNILRGILSSVDRTTADRDKHE